MKYIILSLSVFLLLTSCRTLPESEEGKRLKEDGRWFYEVPNEERLRVINGANNQTFFIEYVGTPFVTLEEGRTIWIAKASEICTGNSYTKVFVRNHLEAKIASDLPSQSSSFDPNLYCNAGGVADCIVGSILGLFIIDALEEGERKKNDGNRFPVVDGKIICGAK